MSYHAQLLAIADSPDQVRQDLLFFGYSWIASHAGTVGEARVLRTEREHGGASGTHQPHGNPTAFARRRIPQIDADINGGRVAPKFVLIEIRAANYSRPSEFIGEAAFGFGRHEVTRYE